MTKAPTATQKRIYQAAMQLFAERGGEQLSISDLAQYADLARGTIYKNIESLDRLFEEVAASLVLEMNQRIVDQLKEINDPALKLACGIRLYIKRAHEEPVWGKFMTRFAFTGSAMRELWSGHAVRDVMEGIRQGRYQLKEEQLLSGMAQVGSSVIAAIYLVREGLVTWREAGSSAAELTLRAFGLPLDEACKLAACDMDSVLEHAHF
jgi:AcrR family transcriptional regulator